MRDPKRVMAATVLVFEALVVVFASLVAKDLSGLSTAPRPSAGGAVLALRPRPVVRPARAPRRLLVGLAAAGRSSSPPGLVLPVMLGVGLLFTGLWVAALVIGTRIERERGAAAVLGWPP